MALLDLFRRTPKETAVRKFTVGGGREGVVTLGEMATRESAETMFNLTSLLPNPDPVLRKAGISFATYRELLSDAHLGAVIDTRKDSVRELEWSIDRGRARSRQTQAIEAMFRELDIYQIITEILDAPLFGYQPMEYIWDERDGLIWLQNIVGKPQEWFAFDDQNEPRFLDPREPGMAGVPLPDGKFAIPQHDPRYTNPYGVPLLSRVYWPITFARGGTKFWVTFMEKYGMPWIFAKHPDDLAQEKVNALVAALDTIRQDGVMSFPMSSVPEVVPNGQRASADIYDMFLSRTENWVSKAILGHGAAADSTSGKLGNEEGAMTAKWGRAASDKRLVENVFNDAIKWIHRYNWANGDLPRFGLWEEEDVDQGTADRDVKLFAIGWRPTPEYIVKAYGMEEKEFTLVEPAAAPMEFSEEDGQAIEGAATTAQASTKTQRELVDPLEDLLEHAKDFETAMEKMVEKYPDLSTSELEEKLVKLMFISDLSGRISVVEDEDDDA